MGRFGGQVTASGTKWSVQQNESGGNAWRFPRAG